MDFYDVVDKIGKTIDGAGVIVIVVGAVIAFAGAVIRLTRREADVYRRFRELLGRTILLGLELLVAGDIVRTVAATPTLTSVAVLGGIVLIRTFLSFLAGGRDHRALALAKAHRCTESRLMAGSGLVCFQRAASDRRSAPVH